MSTVCGRPTGWNRGSGISQIRQSPGLALNAHSGNEWGQIPVLTGSIGYRRTAIAETHTDSFDRDRLTYSHYNSIRFRAFIALGVISIDLAILRKKAGIFRQYGKSKRTAIAENHTHSFDRVRLTYSHYNSIRIRAFLAMDVIYIDLAILRKNAGNFRQYGKSKRTAIAENHTHSFDRDRLTYSHYNSIRFRAFIALGVISIDQTILRKNAGNFRQFGKSKRTAIAENHTHSFGRDRLTYFHYNSIRIRAFIAMGVISIDLAILRKTQEIFGNLVSLSGLQLLKTTRIPSIESDSLTPTTTLYGSELS